jgi:Fe-S-cluster containining protein
LFADVELTGIREATELEILGFKIETDDSDVGLLPQPCRALRGRRCSIYAHRPRAAERSSVVCCRTPNGAS